MGLLWLAATHMALMLASLVRPYGRYWRWLPVTLRTVREEREEMSCEGSSNSWLLHRERMERDVHWQICGG